MGETVTVPTTTEPVTAPTTTEPVTVPTTTEPATITTTTEPVTVPTTTEPVTVPTTTETVSNATRDPAAVPAKVQQLLDMGFTLPVETLINVLAAANNDVGTALNALVGSF